MEVTIGDAVGNTRTYTRAELTALGFPTEITVISVQDTTPPDLTALSITPAGVDVTNGAAAIRADFTITDDLSGAALFGGTFRSPSGSHSTGFNTAVPNGRDVTSLANGEVPRNSEPGTWILTIVTVIDAVGNSRSYATSELLALGFPTELQVTSVQDTTPPELTAFTFSPTTVHVVPDPAELQADFTITDDLSGAATFGGTFRSPSGAQTTGFNTAVPNSTNVTYFAAGVVPQFSELGVWVLQGLTVVDAANNVRHYTTTELEARGWPTRLTVAGARIQTVLIDLKPGTFPNGVSPGRPGVIPVAVLTTDAFDARTVDPATIRFGATGNEAAAVNSSLEDVDRDGDVDSLFHFRTQDTGIACGDTAAHLTGLTIGGQAIHGSDAIKTVGCK